MRKAERPRTQEVPRAPVLMLVEPNVTFTLSLHGEAFLPFSTPEINVVETSCPRSSNCKRIP